VVKALRMLIADDLDLVRRWFRTPFETHTVWTIWAGRTPAATL